MFISYIIIFCNRIFRSQFFISVTPFHKESQSSVRCYAFLDLQVPLIVHTIFYQCLYLYIFSYYHLIFSIIYLFLLSREEKPLSCQGSIILSIPILIFMLYHPQVSKPSHRQSSQPPLQRVIQRFFFYHRSL